LSGTCGGATAAAGWFLALATLIAAMPILLFAVLLVCLPGVGALFP